MLKIGQRELGMVVALGHGGCTGTWRVLKNLQIWSGHVLEGRMLAKLTW